MWLFHRTGDMEAILFSLKQFDFMFTTPVYFALSSNILLGMSRAHWRFVFD
jgi:hypothetical protein